MPYVKPEPGLEEPAYLDDVELDRRLYELGLLEQLVEKGDSDGLR